jgi:catechol 2,3-dioxygenase-like lactoylglutathione lyase family enzyme
MTETMMSHVTLCVRDLQASTRFYVESFGFEAPYRRAAGDDFAPLLGLPTLDLELVMLRLGNQRLELVGHRSSPHPRTELPMNTVGFTHIAFHVPDIDEAVARIEAHGGAVDKGSRIAVSVNGEDREYVFTRDPDGNRVELIRGSVLG